LLRWLKTLLRRPHPPQAPAASRESRSHTLTSVVLVEDNARLRSVIRQILQKESDLYIAGDAEDALTGLEVLRKARPDVLVTDLLLPGLSGMELIRLVRDQLPGIAIVAISIHLEDPYVRGAFEKGATAFVHKTCLHEHLAEAIRSALIGKRFLKLP
jgi:two-component system, NarL family, invasion response regulator UvrY